MRPIPDCRARESAYIGEMLLRALFAYFENWIQPFAVRDGLQPPERLIPYIWFYIRQAKAPFIAMLILGGLTAAIEATLFWFVGRVVDILATVKPADGWSGLLAAHGAELFGMLVLIGIVRFVVSLVMALVDQQVITPGFYNLVRWQSYLHVSRQSLSFFQNDFSGRIVTKVWSGGQAVGDVVTSLMESVWFVGIYSVSTLVLVGQLDLSLAVVVLLWLIGFAFLARYFVPRIRKHSKETAEASSMLSGRMVDAYSNMQTLKLFCARRGKRPLHAEGLRYLPGYDPAFHPVHHRRARLHGVSVGDHDRHHGRLERRSLAVRGNQLRCRRIYHGADPAAEFSP